MYFFRSNDFHDNNLLHCVECDAKVVTEEARADYFDLDESSEEICSTLWEQMKMEMMML